jgi:acetaldehyde dehydrogenase
MVSCGGQATIPMVAAVHRVVKVRYAEIVASIASRSAGPGTRANIDEFTQTTARAIESVGGAAKGKAIIVLNPAEPPLIMRNTIFCLSDDSDPAPIDESIRQMAAEVQTYVPGYRLKQEVQFEQFSSSKTSGLKTSIFLEVEGAGHYLPPYAGNLDIMTAAALKTGERLAAA